jgi:hypothetical protein
VIADRLWLAPTWVRWLVQTLTILPFFVAYVGWGFPTFIHRAGWISASIGLVALCVAEAGVLIWARRPVDARYRAALLGLTKPQTLQALTALRTGEAPDDPAALASAIAMGELGRAYRRGRRRWQRAVQWWVPPLIVAGAIVEYLWSLPRLAWLLVALAAFVLVRPLIRARRDRRRLRNLESLRAAAGSRDLALPPADEDEVAVALPRQRARKALLGVVMPWLIFMTWVIVVDLPRPDCSTANAVFATIYDSRQLTEPQSVDWRSPDLAAYEDWSNRLLQFSSQATNPAVAPHLRRIGDLSVAAVSHVRAAQAAPNGNTEAEKKAYYGVVRQMVDEEYTLSAYCS